MPFLLCFSYRLYYQYIFIYFSASSSDKENSSIIFLITSSVNNSPFSFPADVADAGSRQPSSVDFTGPIYFTLSRNTEKPTAVPIITITAMMIQAGSSRSASENGQLSAATRTSVLYRWIWDVPGEDAAV